MLEHSLHTRLLHGSLLDETRCHISCEAVDLFWRESFLEGIQHEPRGFQWANGRRSANDAPSFLGLILSPILFGLLAWAFLAVTDGFKRSLGRPIDGETQRLIVARAAWSIVAFVPSLQRYAGPGEGVIQESFHVAAPAFDSLAKLLATAFAVGSGFNGSEVTPILFMGATAASARAGILGFAVPVCFLATLVMWRAPLYSSSESR